MKRFLAWLICALGLTGFAQAAPLAPDQFAQVFAKALQGARPGIAVAVKGELELSITAAGGKESTAFLNNAYTQYLRDPKALDEVVKTYVASFLETSGHADEAIDRARIIPVIKDRRWLAEVRESMAQRGAKQVPESVYEDLNEELVILYAEDSPKNIRYFAPKALEELGIAREGLRRLAVDNLKRLMPTPQIRAGAGLSMITAGGDYEASLLLFDDLWASLPPTDGEIVVAVPARDLLVFTGSRNRQGIDRLRALAAKFARESAYRLTDTLFVYRNGRFVRFEER